MVPDVWKESSDTDGRIEFTVLSVREHKHVHMVVPNVHQNVSKRDLFVTVSRAVDRRSNPLQAVGDQLMNN